MTTRRNFISAALFPLLISRAGYSVAENHASLLSLLTENEMKFDHKKGQYITSDDARLYVEEIGSADAPALILLHGGFGDMESYNSIVPALGKSFRLIGIDTRGHGASTLGKQPLTYALLADDLAHIIQTLGFTKYSIMGFSDGGTTAYCYAAKQPQGLEKIITIGSGWELNEGDPEWNMYSEISGKVWKRMFPESYDSYIALNPEADWDAFANNVIDMWKNLGAGNYPFEQVKNIAAEALVIRGDKDPLTTLNSMARLMDRLQNAHYLNIPFAEHTAFDDQPDVFMNAVGQFLKVQI